jgi:hypothetical protein
MAADPHAAADIARALAEALAATGASVDDIAAMMNEAMATSLMASAGIFYFIILLRKKKKNWPKANFFKQIGIFRKKGFPYEKFPY